jgi:hypothetical protein
MTRDTVPPLPAGKRARERGSETNATPHYVRFARALALVSFVAGATAAEGCAQARQTIGCGHCYCPGATRSLERPIACETIDLDFCCSIIIEGPLPPPELAG